MIKKNSSIIYRYINTLGFYLIFISIACSTIFFIIIISTCQVDAKSLIYLTVAALSPIVASIFYYIRKIDKKRVSINIEHHNAEQYIKNEHSNQFDDSMDLDPIFLIKKDANELELIYVVSDFQEEDYSTSKIIIFKNESKSDKMILKVTREEFVNEIVITPKEKISFLIKNDTKVTFKYFNIIKYCKSEEEVINE